MCRYRGREAEEHLNAPRCRAMFCEWTSPSGSRTAIALAGNLATNTTEKKGFVVVFSNSVLENALKVCLPPAPSQQFVPAG